MRTVVTFRSEVFNSKETKEHFINPENFGDDIARWLSDQLPLHNVKVDRSGDFPGQEDFGWFLNCETVECPYCVVIGHHYDGDEFEWVLWIERKCGLVKSLLGGRKKDISSLMPDTLHAILSNSNDIQSIRWHRRTDFDQGKLNQSVDEPRLESTT